MTCWRLRRWWTCFSNKVFLINVWTCSYRYSAIAHSTDESVDIIYMCWETKMFLWLALLWHSIYCSGLKQNLLYLWSLLISHVFKFSVERNWGFPDGSVVKNPPASAGNVDSIPELGRSPRVGNGSPLQYSCLENTMDRRSWSMGLQRVWHDWRDLAPTHISIFYFLLLTNWGSSVIFFFWLLFLTFLIGIINQSKVKKRSICDIWGGVYNIIYILGEHHQNVCAATF